MTKRSLILLLLCLWLPQYQAEEEALDINYIQIEPIIVTNYLKKSMKKPGFIQISAQLMVKGQVASDKLELHMPLVRDYVIDFLSFTTENVIKDVTKRKELRTSLATGIKKMLTKQIGEPIIDDLIITHFMWN